MLSIIISSYQPHYYTALEKNIAETCGVKYEIIKIENFAAMGLCEAYNKGANKAKYDQLLFLHEDVKFNKNNWGHTLVRLLSSFDTGIIGLAGGTYVPSSPYGWFTTMENAKINIIQHKKDGKVVLEKTFDTEKEKVLAVDGVFLGIRKSVYIEFPFNNILKGYHGYDTDLSLRVSKKYQNFVTSKIVLEHYSEGKPDKDWFETNIYIRKSIGSNFNTTVNKDLEYQLYERFVRQYFGYYPKNIITFFKVLRFFPYFKIGKRKYIPLLKFVFSQL
ncbi:glycosyltransferase [Chryseobacterium binzhouense]|uniref:glycosyltransferase n=1 Tax=Chryseobacterium binzhouense TaxID=2593646 RepID=UPI00117DBD8E|nr:glycosyltransferase [Chryseobacterium binzhouense]